MILKITAKIPEEDQFDLSVDGNSRTIDSISPSVSMVVTEGIHSIGFEQKTTQTFGKWASLILFVLTLPIQGIFHIMLLNVDLKWYSNIRAFFVKAEFKIEVKQNTEVCVNYMDSKYDSMNKEWRLPVLTCVPSASSNIRYLINTKDFSDQFVQFLKKVISIAFVGLILFIFLFYTSIKNDILIASIISSVVIVGIIIWTVIMISLQRRKMKELLSSFIAQVSRDNEGSEL